MFGIGIAELSIILVIILIIFGAGKLPEIGAAIGAGIRNFKVGVNGPDKENEKTIKTIEPAQKNEVEKLT
ncbi:MAG: twin-arginine translocase TatA/TatE family subunit [bacterium]